MIAPLSQGCKSANPESTEVPLVEFPASVPLATVPLSVYEEFPPDTSVLLAAEVSLLLSVEDDEL